MLFKHLTSSDKAAVAHAQEGLAAIIAHQKMPKQLLQTSLRPILVNLAYYNKLRLPLLHGLERLLQLLASWFNVTLGSVLSPLSQFYPLIPRSPAWLLQKPVSTYLIGCLEFIVMFWKAAERDLRDQIVSCSMTAWTLRRREAHRPPEEVARAGKNAACQQVLGQPSRCRSRCRNFGAVPPPALPSSQVSRNFSGTPPLPQLNNGQ